MEASAYEIKSWNPIMLGNNVSQCPTISIVPDTNFIQFAKNNEFQAFCKISNSKTAYNEQTFRCTINKSSVVPNCRPNFYAAFGFYIVTLHTCWIGGYPPPNNLGSVHFYGLASPITPSEANQKFYPLTNNIDLISA